MFSINLLILIGKARGSKPSCHCRALSKVSVKASLAGGASTSCQRCSAVPSGCHQGLGSAAEISDSSLTKSKCVGCFFFCLFVFFSLSFFGGLLGFVCLFFVGWLVDFGRFFCLFVCFFKNMY